MKETETINGYSQAKKNISSLYERRQKRGLTTRELSRLSGVSQSQIVDYEAGKSLPTIRSYNKLAQLFGWRKISAKTFRQVRKEQDVPSDEDLAEPTAEIVPKNPEYEFEIGKSYEILETGRDVKEPVADCVFCYESKEGIHHVFREVKGGWTRTYTDAQLVGKKIKASEK